MGANIARRLREVGYPITAIYDVQRGAAIALAAELGAEACTKLARVTALSDVVITVVTDDKAMLGLFKTSKDSLFKGAKGRIFINCATVAPKTHLKVEQWAQKAKAKTLEACMASSITQARSGELYLMCGGERSTYEAVLPLLQQLAKDLKYIGTTGRAATLKALVNMVMNINTAGLAEGLGLASALGFNLAQVIEVFSQTGADSRVLATDGEDMMKRDHACFFSAEHAAKDSDIALSLAKGRRMKLPLATATLAQYNKMKRLRLGHLDKSGIAELTFPGRAPKAKK